MSTTYGIWQWGLQMPLPTLLCSLPLSSPTPVSSVPTYHHRYDSVEESRVEDDAWE